MKDSTGITTYTYDSLARLTGKSDPGSVVQAYTYDASGQQTRPLDPDGGVFTWTYDEDGNQDLVIDPDSLRTTLLFNAAGRKGTMIDASGLTEIYLYEPVGRQTTQIYQAKWAICCMRLVTAARQNLKLGRKMRSTTALKTSPIVSELSAANRFSVPIWRGC